MKIITPDTTTLDVTCASDSKPMFAKWIKEAMEQTGEYDFRVHLYLADVLTSYSSMEKILATVHDNKEEPTALQLVNLEMDSKKDRNYKYNRFKSLGDTMLFTVGFFPESFSSISARPSIDYFVSMGELSYSKAADTVCATHHTQSQAELMNTLSSGFKRYAGILFYVRQDKADLSLPSRKLVAELADVLGDKGILEKYHKKKDSLRKRQ